MNVGVYKTCAGLQRPSRCSLGCQAAASGRKHSGRPCSSNLGRCEWWFAPKGNAQQLQPQAAAASSVQWADVHATALGALLACRVAGSGQCFWISGRMHRSRRRQIRQHVVGCCWLIVGQAVWSCALVKWVSSRPKLPSILLLICYDLFLFSPQQQQGMLPAMLCALCWGRQVRPWGSTALLTGQRHVGTCRGWLCLCIKAQRDVCVHVVRACRCCCTVA